MRRTILVIDDDYFMRKLMEVMLTRGGHTVFVAGDTDEAYEMLARFSIEIITCDIMMPNVDGLDFLRLLKSDAIYNKIPVIVVTAAGVQKTIRQALELGAFCVVEKPFTDADLQSAIEKINT